MTLRQHSNARLYGRIQDDLEALAPWVLDAPAWSLDWLLTFQPEPGEA